VFTLNDANKGLAREHDQWFTDASHNGAFGIVNRTSGWTLLSESGLID
jgi:hypothetical protein